MQYSVFHRNSAANNAEVFQSRSEVIANNSFSRIQMESPDWNDGSQTLVVGQFRVQQPGFFEAAGLLWFKLTHYPNFVRTG